MSDQQTPAPAQLPPQLANVDALSNFPPAFGYAHLSILLGKAVPSLQTDRCRRPWILPPSCKWEGSKQPIWLLTDVLEWLAERRQETPPAPTAAPAPAPRRAGRPTKREQLERARRAGGAA